MKTAHLPSNRLFLVAVFFTLAGCAGTPKQREELLVARRASTHTMDVWMLDVGQGSCSY